MGGAPPFEGRSHIIQLPHHDEYPSTCLSRNGSLGGGGIFGHAWLDNGQQRCAGRPNYVAIKELFVVLFNRNFRILWKAILRKRCVGQGWPTGASL